LLINSAYLAYRLFLFDSLIFILFNPPQYFCAAGGTVNGSIINYSDETTMSISGNSDLYFNRSGTSQVPAGFVPEIVLQYDPSSYSEIIL